MKLCGTAEETKSLLPSLHPQSFAGGSSHSFANSPSPYGLQTSSQRSAARGFVKLLYKVWKTAQDAPVLTKQRSCLICTHPELPNHSSHGSPQHWLEREVGAGRLQPETYLVPPQPRAQVIQALRSLVLSSNDLTGRVCASHTGAGR